MNAKGDLSSGVGTSLWLQDLVHGLSGTMIKVKHTVFTGASPFQKIEVFDTYRYGRVLCLGGSIVMTEKDEHVYHEMIVHPALVAHPQPRRVCIIGGGDGGCLKEVLKHETVEQVVIIEIDRMVRETVVKHFPRLGKGFKDKRVEVVIDDGYNYLKNSESRFDVIIVDSYDPAGPVQSLETADFHQVVAARLAGKGLAVFQTDSPIVRPDYLRQTASLISPRFAQVKPYTCSFSSFPEGVCCFLLCGQVAGALEGFDGKRCEAITASCSYYNSDLQVGAFLLPQYIRKIVAGVKR